MKTVIECAYCDGTAQLKKQNKKLTYRKEDFKVVAHYYHCNHCNEEFTTNEVDAVTMLQLHNQYREKHSIPFPEEIIALKEKYELSAAKMSVILGLGANGYNLYERGEIPVPAMGNLIKAAANPDFFLTLLEEAKKEFRTKEYEDLKARLEIIGKSDNDKNPYQLDLFKTPNSYNGFRVADIEKLSNILVAFIFACDPIYNDKLKLNKLLFYADFVHYKRYGFSITGIAYRAIQYGPVPSKYGSIFNYLESENVICANWFKDEKNGVREVFQTNLKIEETLFNVQELETINDVINKFKDIPTWDIVEISHEEKAWLDHNNDKSLISYQKYAFDLKGV